VICDSDVLRLPALEIRQGPSRVLYSFAVDGKILPEFATISRVRRDPESDIRGYQRPEVLSHIAEIRAYLESDRPMIPNSVVVAFDSRVRFEPSEVQPLGPGYSRVGTIVIPMGRDIASEDKPGWIVDGQQRTAAIALRMVEAETIRETRGRESVILLDDVFAELDPGRSQRIVEWIESAEGGQVILTSPKPTDFQIHGDTLPRWTIRNGVVSAY